MAAFLDGCRFNPAATGTADWAYLSAVTGYQSPAAANVTNGRLYKYRAESADLSQWEMGEGIYNSSTGVLTRATVLYNSNGDRSKINFLTVPQVAIVALKADLISVEEANGFSAAQQAQARSNIGISPVGAAPVGHVPGETAGGLPAAGEIGEESHAAAGLAFTTSGVTQYVLGLVVPAGDLEVYGYCDFAGASYTTSSEWITMVSTSPTPTITNRGAFPLGACLARSPAAMDYVKRLTIGPVAMRNAGATTIYMHAQATFFGGMYSYSGFLKYRRAR
jgi:hypothetical protein